MFADTMCTHGSHRYMQAEHSYEINSLKNKNRETKLYKMF